VAPAAQERLPAVRGQRNTEEQQQRAGADCEQRLAAEAVAEPHQVQSARA
jgi:hypothetical protein